MSEPYYKWRGVPVVVMPDEQHLLAKNLDNALNALREDLKRHKMPGVPVQIVATYEIKEADMNEWKGWVA